MSELKAAYEEIVGELLPSAIGRNVSRREREDTFRIGDVNLTYGEMGFDAVAAVLFKIRDVYGKPRIGHSGRAGVMQSIGAGNFIDLGSGMGKAVITAAVVHAFEKVVGVELLEGLHQISIELQKEVETIGPGLLLTEGGDVRLSTIEFIRGDILDAGLADADVVLIHSACFTDKLMANLARHLSLQLKSGSFVITVSVQLPQTAEFDCVDAFVHELDGNQEALLFLHQKVGERS